MNIKNNIWILRVFNILNAFIIVVPILTIFWLEKGLDMKDVFLLQSIFAFVVLVLEVPSWYFADNYWRKLSLVLWSIVYFLWFLLYPFWEGFLYFAMIEVLLWIWCSFVSWADSALLYDTLLELKREKEYHKIESQYFSFSWYFHAFGSIIWWFFAKISLVFPFFVQIPFMFLLIPFSLLVNEPKKHKDIIDEKQKSMKWILTHTLHKHKEIKWLIMFSAFLTASTLASVWFAQPYWKDLNIPISLFGIIWAVLIFLRWLSSHFSPHIEKALWKKYSLWLLLALPFIGYMWLTIFDKYLGSIIFFLGFHFAFGISTPIIKKYLNELVSSKIRATVLSIQSMLWRAVFVVVWPIIWYFLDVLSYTQAFLISWSFFFIVWFICLIVLRKYRVI